MGSILSCLVRVVEIAEPETGVLDLERRVHAYINKYGRHNSRGVRRDIDWSQVQFTFATKPSETFTQKGNELITSSTVTASCENTSNDLVKQTIINKGDVRVSRQLDMTTTIRMSGNEKIPLQIPDSLARVGVQMKPSTYTGGFEELEVSRSLTSQTEIQVDRSGKTITSNLSTTTEKYSFQQRTRINGKVIVSYYKNVGQLISTQEIPITALFSQLGEDFAESNITKKSILKTTGYVEFNVSGNAAYTYDTVLKVKVSI